MDYICDRCGVNESNFMSICDKCKEEVGEIEKEAKAFGEKLFVEVFQNPFLEIYKNTTSYISNFVKNADVGVDVDEKRIHREIDRYLNKTSFRSMKEDYNTGKLDDILKTIIRDSITITFNGGKE